MSIRDVGNVSGRSKEMYGEIIKESADTKFLKKASEKLEKNFRVFDVIKTLIYCKNKKVQKDGWEMYHNLSPKDQKAFKTEIRAEEKARKAK